MAPSRRLRASGSLMLALALGGCVALGRYRVGEVPSPAAVTEVSEGASIGDVLARLDAPVESWLAPDGLLLVWRERRYNYERLEIDPSRPLAYVPIDPILGSALENIKLILERGALREERIAVLFDRDGRVVAVAQRDGEGRRLR